MAELINVPDAATPLINAIMAKEIELAIREFISVFYIQDHRTMTYIPIGGPESRFSKELFEEWITILSGKV